MAEDYQYIPNEALDLEQRTDAANQWASAQRQQLADAWANAQRQAVAPMLSAVAGRDREGDYSPAQPSPDAQDGGSTDQGGAQDQPQAPSGLETAARASGGQGVPSAASSMGLSSEPRQDLAPPQFGNPELTAEQAYAACGPVAAVAFARSQGRNPTLTEAMQLARQVGWTQAGGMNGIANQKALLDRMGISSRLDTSPDPTQIAQDVEGGNPVIISTPGHYFVAQAARSAAGGETEFYVGNTGANALRGGKPWMTLDEMQRRMGTVNGALFVDHPLADGASTTERPGNAVATAADLQGAEPYRPDMNVPYTPPGEAQPQQPAGSLPGQAMRDFTPDVGPLSGIHFPKPGEPIPKFKDLGEALGAAGQEALQRNKPTMGPGGLGILNPNLNPPGEGAGEGAVRQGLAEAEDVGPALARGLPTEGAAAAAAGSVGGLAKTVSSLPDGAQKAINELLYPARNTPQPVQDLLWDWAGRRLKSAVEGETWQLQANQAMGKTGGAAAANMFEHNLQFAERPTPEQEALAARWKQFADESGATGRELGYIKGDVTQPPDVGAVITDRPIKVGDTVIHQDGRRLTVLDASEPGVLHVRPEDAAPRSRGIDVARANVSLPAAPEMAPGQVEGAETQGVIERALAGEHVPAEILGPALQARYGTPAAWIGHIWQDELAQAEKTARARGLGSTDFFSFERLFPTYQAGQDFGKKPVDDLGIILRMSAERELSSEANARFVQGLKGLGPEYIQQAPEAGAKAPQGWVIGKGQFTGYMFPEPIAHVVDNVTSPSAFRTNIAGRALTTTLALGKQSLFPLSGFHFVTELRQSYRANGADGLPAIGKAVQAYINPAAYEAWRAQPDTAALYSAVARSGVTGLTKLPPPDVGPVPGGGIGPTLARMGMGAAAGSAYGWTSAKAAGADDQTALERGLLGAGIGAAAGPLGKVLSDGLWERAIPTLKVLTWQIQRESGMGTRQAAEFVNDTYGGQNLEGIGRSRTVQDALRLAILAPDWWESWANRLGSTVTGFRGPSGPTVLSGSKGAASRAFWLRTAVIDGAFGLEGLNYALNGHFTDQNDPDHRFDLETTGLYDRAGWDRTDPRTGEPARKYIDILGPIRSMLTAPGNPINFARGRLGILPSVGLEALLNKDAQGNDITQPGESFPRQAAEIGATALSRVAPIGPTILEQTSRRGEPTPMSVLSAATGMRLSSETASQAANKGARELFNQRWSQEYDSLRASPAYQQATPARQIQMMSQAQERVLAQAKIDAEAPATDLGRGGKYNADLLSKETQGWGVSPAVAERRVDGMVKDYQDWRSSLKTSRPLPRPDEQTIRIGAIFSNPRALNPAYTATGREQRRELVGAGR